MKNESVKMSFERSKNVPEEKRKTVKRKICIKKTNTFTITALNFVQEQLIIDYMLYADGSDRTIIRSYTTVKLSRHSLHDKNLQPIKLSDHLHFAFNDFYSVLAN